MWKMSIKQHLLKCIDIAIRHRQKYVAVLVELPTGNHEVIVFKRDSYADKIINAGRLPAREYLLSLIKLR